MKIIDSAIVFAAAIRLLAKRFFKKDWETFPNSTDPYFERLFAVRLLPVMTPLYLLTARFYPRLASDIVVRAGTEAMVDLGFGLYLFAVLARTVCKVHPLKGS